MLFLSPILAATLGHNKIRKWPYRINIFVFYIIHPVVLISYIWNDCNMKVNHNMAWKSSNFGSINENKLTEIFFI